METWHDNSANNPVNPNHPPKPVGYGEQSTDEMSLCIFEVTCERIGDLLSLIQDDSRHRKLLGRAIALTQKGEKR